MQSNTEVLVNSTQALGFVTVHVEGPHESVEGFLKDYFLEYPVHGYGTRIEKKNFNPPILSAKVTRYASAD